MVNQYTDGILLDEETPALDVLDRVGPGGHYLAEAHTVRHLRDVWYSQLFERSSDEAWCNDGENHFKERLHELTRKAMMHKPAPLEPEIIEELDRMRASWK